MRRWRKKLKDYQTSLRKYIEQLSIVYCSVCGTLNSEYKGGNKCTHCGHIFSGGYRRTHRGEVVLIRGWYAVTAEMQQNEDKRFFGAIDSV